ncbi:MAG TPA: two-component regulator propeller domain-containing protein, partial [Niastella sp.]
MMVETACRNVKLVALKRTAGLLLWLACCLTGVGQQLTFNRLTVENGLLSNSVLSIAQERQSFLWFGTSIGLTRYDGARFKVYLPSSNITSLYCDKANNLWAGTSGGLDHYNVQKDAFEKILINGKRIGNIHCIYEDKKGRLWIGSINGLHLLTDPVKKTFQSFYAGADGNSIAGNVVRSVIEDKAGNLWVGTNNGLTKMQWVNGQVKYFTFRNQPGNANSLIANYITSIAEDTLHNLWIGTQHDGISFYNPATNTFTNCTHTNNQSGLINNNIRKVLSTSR